MIPKVVQIKFDKIEKDRIALRQELSAYSNEQLNKNPENGGWSPMQVIQHVVESERDILKYMQLFNIDVGFNFELVIPWTIRHQLWT